ncbi:peptide chain release factor N(5)-glutamine methyltransferase [Cellulomonas chengniuliangii]|uniref:Release factor glutamine methyltransferase n=1 Tax=Cellulomonas chengniuliangii TaxID=2968084 RepID=A0ABY5L441_9CELL|nr:peptide chain release factor N(5)-glutamine methyltransferase [Cellulomonas chengniuliangii]MCC2310110.1 peptide chain release factor N(5)-glutamine methyltransferase [Cellulomonas chengniuliangii]UUI76225.1 peptide chain release factor N(5)-glutamine methyltransferase [Cellulomonas chengniuliangii]
MGDDAARLPEALRAAERALAAAGVPSPRVDAELLAAHLLGIEAGRAMSRGEVQAAAILGRPAPAGLDELVARRAAREPLQHLVGSAAFRGLVLSVGPGVFVPRPETEQVAEHAVREAQALLAGGARARVVDLCTGSAAIALAVAHEAPGAEVHAVELDAAAHAWAARNVAAVAPGVRLLRGDARTALRELDGTVDVVVSNPPYVPPGAVPVDPEVAEHDPAVALYGLGADGLEVPRGIAAAAARLLRPGGLFVMEHAEVQDAAARALVVATGAFAEVRTETDLTGRARMVLARRQPDGGGVDGPLGVGDSQP